MQDIRQILSPKPSSKGQHYRFFGAAAELITIRGDETIISGPADCLAAETLLYDYRQGKTVPVASLTQRAVLPTLLGAAEASAVFRKGKAKLYKVTASDGRSFVASPKHLVLTENGWRYVGALQNGERLLLCAEGQRQTNGASCPSIQPLDAQSYDGTVLNCQSGYGAYFHPYDALLQRGAGSALNAAPSLIGVPLHNRVGHSSDALADEQGYNHHHLQPCHHASADYSPLFARRLRLDYALGYNGQRNVYLYQADEQSHFSINPVSLTAQPEQDYVLQRLLLSFGSPWLALYHNKVQPFTVSSVRFEREDWFYDLTVPAAGHYIDAAGFIHHNTGKTLAALWLLNFLAWEYPGMQAAIVRKEYASMAGSVLQTFQRRILLPSDGVVAYGGDKAPSRFIYPNGSVIWVGGLDKASKALSSERDVIYVNQSEELIQYDWEILRTRASERAGNMPFAMLYGDCNPQTPIHWIKQLEAKKVLRLLYSDHRDNPSIYDPETGELTEMGKRRLAKLDSLSGATYKRLRLGLWASPEGAIYDVYDDDKHKVAAFTPPRIWPRVVGVDPYGAYVGALFLAFDPKGQILNVYREYYRPFGETTPQHVSNLLSLAGYEGRQATPEAENIFAWIGGGPSENQIRLDWENAGIPLIESGVFDVWVGIDRVYQLMRDFKLVIHDSCPQLLTEIGSYRRKLKEGEPTNEIENKTAYHLLDCLRYAVAWLTNPYSTLRVGEIDYQIGNY